MDNPQGQPSQAKGENKDAKINLAHIEAGIDALAKEIKSSNDRNENDKWPKRTGKAALVYTGITFVILLITGYQAYLSRQTLVTVQRAFIIPQIPHIEQVTDPRVGGQGWKVDEQWKNSGTTLARDTRLHFHCQILKEDEDYTFFYIKPPENSVIIPPQGEGSNGHVLVASPAMEEVISGHTKLTCYGEAIYKDLFMNPHITRFCLAFIGFEKNGASAISGSSWESCKKPYDCIDEECKS